MPKKTLMMIFLAGSLAVAGVALKGKPQTVSPSVSINCPGGIVGQPYFCQLTIVGMTPPIKSCTVNAGQLPDGLALVITGSGTGCAIQGTPTTPSAGPPDSPSPIKVVTS